MKLRSTEFLAAIAIITSAAVVQIREDMPAREAASASEQTTSPPSCGITRDGLMPAACEPTSDDRQDPAVPRRRSASQIWV